MAGELPSEHLVIVKELARLVLRSPDRARFLDEIDLSDAEADRVLGALEADLDAG